MGTTHFIFQMYNHNEYDSECIQRLIKIEEDQSTSKGFKYEADAENWILEYGKNGLQYIILKVFKPLN